jgi:hypothetical protein
LVLPNAIPIRFGNNLSDEPILSSADMQKKEASAGTNYYTTRQCITLYTQKKEGSARTN